MNGFEMAMVIMVVVRVIMMLMLMRIMAAVGPAGVIMFMLMIMSVIMVMVVVAMIMMRMIIRFEKIGLQFQDTIQIESIALQNRVERHIRFHGEMQDRVGINAADARLNLSQFFFCHQIGFIEDDDIRKSDLRFRFGSVFQPIVEPFGVGERHHSVKLRCVFDIGVDEKGLRNRRRIGKTGGLDNDRVKLAAPAH